MFDTQEGTILDSGTTFAYLPHAAFTAIKSAVIFLPIYLNIYVFIN